jgi:hypothetical protein
VSYFTHRFDAPIVRHGLGHLQHTVLWLPSELARELPFAEHPRLRIEADVSGYPLHAAWQPAGGRWYLLLSRRVMKDAGFTIGDVVEVSFRLASPDRVEVPEELGEALRKDRRASKAWDALTSGAKRGHAYRVASAKRAETRAARVAEVLAAVKQGLDPQQAQRARRTSRASRG